MDFSKTTCSDIFQAFLNTVVCKGGTVRYVQDAVINAPPNVTQRIADAHMGCSLLREILHFHNQCYKEFGRRLEKIMKPDRSADEDAVREEMADLNLRWMVEIAQLSDKINADRDSAVETMEQLFEKKEKMGDGLYLKMTEMVKIKHDFCENQEKYVSHIQDCIGPAPFGVMGREVWDWEAKTLMETIRDGLEVDEPRIKEAIEYAFKTGKMKKEAVTMGGETIIMYYYVLNKEDERCDVRRAYYEMWLRELGVPKNREFLSLIGAYVPILKVAVGKTRLFAKNLNSIAAAFRWDLPSCRVEDEEDVAYVRHFEYMGTTYLRDTANIIYDMESHERIGWWNQRDQTIDPIRD